MTDQNKRTTLKRLGALSAGLTVGGFGASQAIAGREIATGATGLPAASVPSTHELLIHVVHSTSVPESTLMLQNNTAEPMVLGRFMPGNIVFGSQGNSTSLHTDLNRIVAASGPVELKPGQRRSIPISVSTLADAEDTHGLTEYVWASGASMQVSENLQIVRLGAFNADGKLIVYPLDRLSTRSAVPA